MVEGVARVGSVKDLEKLVKGQDEDLLSWLKTKDVFRYGDGFEEKLTGACAARAAELTIRDFARMRGNDPKLGLSDFEKMVDGVGFVGEIDLIQTTRVKLFSEAVSKAETMDDLKTIGKRYGLDPDTVASQQFTDELGVWFGVGGIIQALSSLENRKKAFVDAVVA